MSNSEPASIAAVTIDPEVSQSNDDATEQLVVMRLGAEDYGVDIINVREIIRLQTITRVPQAPRDVEGIINLRGSVIPVIDLRKRFDIPNKDETTETRIVVVDVNSSTVGLVVDEVKEVITVATSAIEPMDDLAAASMSTDLKGIVNLQETLIVLIDLERMVGSTNMAMAS